MGQTLTLALALAVVGYLLGGIPTAYVLGRRFHGVDIRTMGSRNVGTVNAYKLLGWRLGAVVLAVDTGKGAAAMLLAMAAGLADWELFFVAMAVTAGNNWSPYLRLAGGKGLAVVFGISLAVVPLLSVLALPAVVLAFVVTRGLVWAFTAGIAVVNALVIVSGQPVDVVVTCVVLSTIVIVTHFARSLPEIKTAIVERNLRLFGRVE